GPPAPGRVARDGRGFGAGQPGGPPGGGPGGRLARRRSERPARPQDGQGGLLATASCSARVSQEAFLGAVREGAFNAGTELALVEERYQPPDHPVRLQFPEGRYLKFLVLQSV